MCRRVGGGGGINESMRPNELGEGEPEKPRRGAVQACLLYLLVTEREGRRRGEQLKAETTGVRAAFPRGNEKKEAQQGE